MKKIIQTRLHKGIKVEERGNCFPAVIASFMDLDSAEDCIQIQEHYEGQWVELLDNWLNERGWEIMTRQGHRFDNEYYLVSGISPRGVSHICIYKNGRIYHDPHPSQDGIIEETYFQDLYKIKN